MKDFCFSLVVLIVLFSIFNIGCVTTQFKEEVIESMDKPLPYKVAVAPVVFEYLEKKRSPLIISAKKRLPNSKAIDGKGKKKKKKIITTAIQTYSPRLDPKKFKKGVVKQFVERRLFKETFPLIGSSIKNTKACPLTYLTNASLGELLDQATEQKAQMVMVVTVNECKVGNHGFNNLWLLSVNLWWSLWIPNWFINDEEFSASLEITVDLYSTIARSRIYSESFSVEIRHALSDWSVRMGTGEIFGFSLLSKNKKYTPKELEEVHRRFFYPELRKKLHFRMIQTFLRKFVPYSRTIKFQNDLNGIGFPPTISIDIKAGQKFDFQRTKVEVVLGDDRGVKDVQFNLYWTPTNNEKYWEDRPGSISFKIKDNKTRFRRYELSIRFPHKSRYLLQIKCSDQDGNDSVWKYPMEYTDIGRKMLAVVIGVGKYKKGNIPPLSYAAKDARDLANFLRKNRKQLRLEKVIELTEEKATLKAIRHSLGTVLARESTPYDTVLIFYSGHGVAVPDRSSPDKDKFEKYFVPHDSDRDSWYSSSIPMGELQIILRRIQSRRVLIFLDSCYSGFGAKSLSGAGVLIGADFQNRFKRKGLLVMTACDNNQYSYESKKLQNGYFTHFLIRGLSGEADQRGNKNGEVSVNELINYIQNTVAPAVRKGENQTQTPIVSNHLFGDFPLLKYDPKALKKQKKLPHAKRETKKSGPSKKTEKKSEKKKNKK